MSLLLVALLLSSPLIIHVSILHGHVTFPLFFISTVFILVFVRSWFWRLLFAVMTILTVTSLAALDIPDKALLFAIPVLINTGFAIFFGQSLLPGKTPVITLYAILLRSEIDPRVIAYTRHVTQLWTMFFIALATESLILAVFASIEIWSLFANFLNYVFIAVLFAGEYYYRIHHLNDLEHMSFPRFLHRLSKVNLGDLRK